MATPPKFLPVPQPVVDTTTGLMTAPWLLYFQSLTAQAAAAGGAPSSAEYIVGAADSTLTAERVATNSTSNTWNLATAGQAKVERAALTGDVTASANANATTIAANAVTDAKFRQSAGLSAVGRSANSTGNVADITAASDGQVLRRSGTALGFGALDLASANAVTGVLPIANGGIARATLTLTDAQIKALPTTAITLVAATGAGFLARLIAAPSLHLISTSGAYTNINSTYAALVVSYTDNAGPWASNAVLNDNTTTPAVSQFASFLGTTTDKLAWLSVPNVYAIDGAGAVEWTVNGSNTDPGPTMSVVENKALVLSMDNNGSGNLTGGNAANSLKVTIYYVVEAI